MTDSGYAFPTQFPDGNYTAETVGTLGGDPCAAPEPVPEAPPFWGMLAMLMGLLGVSALRQARHSPRTP